MRRTLHTLMHGLIDYAGLFPPARLSMQASVEAYARARMSEHAFVLGRFICPASRLREFSAAAAPLMPGTNATSGYREYADAEPWRVSVLADRPLPETLDLMDAFNAHHANEANGRALADALECKVAAPRDIDPAIDAIPEDVQPVFEFPLAGDFRGFVAALAGNEAGAKIRTGGITPDLIPSNEQVARFIHACADADVRFKATAGLHHAVRAEHALDSTPDAPRAVMHGFLNVFLAAAFVRAERMKMVDTMALLDVRDAAQFKFGDEQVVWRGQVLDLGKLARVRESFALGFGSCSFDEPVSEAAAVG